ncbi:hypothetical protein PVL29_024903 [Vitis rotundifolia]|uniref:TIR domain-containing protein n=1 Tax=Vitis rotundifolia TaxID=103349 RepID=A0AA38YT01_VITRO|nr:hypothetical protein PVL29_024903 [Vitis rotundifolia]
MASSSSSDWEFDVFLSFRGTDTRNTFTGHLNTALKSKGIRTFIDDKELRRGEDISSTLFTTIEKSRCSIVVLSEAYATSKWCLEELVKILECKRIIKQRVVPIFYHLEMHDLLQKMGWTIVTQTSKEPGKRSRLWMQDDICHVLEKNTGTKEVKGIFLNLFGLKEIHFTTEAFVRMNRLRLLKVYESNLSDDSDSESTSRKRQCKVRFSDDFEFHSDELRYLYWHEYPLQTLPSHFKPKNLVCLCMPYSQITELWKGSQVCENLKFLDLSNSKFLMETPDFSRITNLEELVLDGCTNLCHLHSSLGRLRKLAFLSVSNCIKLRDFPAIYELVSLQTLDLSGCSNLQKFPDISQHMPCLSKLYLDGTAITEIPASIAFASELVLLDLTNCKELKFLPSSIAKLTLLRILALSGCSKLGKFQQNSGNLDRLVELKADGSTIRQPPSSRAVLRNHKASASSLPRTSESISFLLSNLNLVRLNLSDCNIKSGKRLSHLGILSSLKSLNLSGNRFIHLPCIFEGLSNLSRLDLHDCRRLQTLPLLPPSVRILNASNCTSLESILPESVFMSFRDCLFGNCLRLMKYPSTMEPHIRSMATHVDQERWRSTYDEVRHDISIEVPQNWYSSTLGSNNNFLGLALSTVGWYPYCDLYTQNDPKSESSPLCCFTDGRTYQLEHTPIESDHLWLAYVPSFFSFSCEKWSCIKFSFGTSRECVVKSCKVCPVYIKGTINDHNKPIGSADQGSKSRSIPVRLGRVVSASTMVGTEPIPELDILSNKLG